jgi:hypothetical protein
VLPDGIVSNQKSQFGSILAGSCNGRCWYFYGHLVYFAAKWHILWPIGTFCGHLVYFSRFGMLTREKSGNPGNR